MARYSLNLPSQLKRDAEEWAASQGVSLNQFILWSVAEKVGSLQQHLDDPEFIHVTYRRGSSGQPHPVLCGTGIRVQTVFVASEHWGLSATEIAEEYGIAKVLVENALAFAEKHRLEIEASLTQEEALEVEDD